MRTIKEIIVHCTATEEGKPFTVADIDAWHREKGWRCIGYHYVVYLDGTIAAKNLATEMTNYNVEQMAQATRN